MDKYCIDTHTYHYSAWIKDSDCKVSAVYLPKGIVPRQMRSQKEEDMGWIFLKKKNGLTVFSQKTDDGDVGDRIKKQEEAQKGGKQTEWERKSERAKGIADMVTHIKWVEIS